ncbi:hypothetical protein KP509_14G068900 [Ceratopteris richardii]|nr:hypothetical protein KP509_14G068900 [Ceratopteris richardii]
MHGIEMKGKTACQDPSENLEQTESDIYASENVNENELCQKVDYRSPPLAQAHEVSPQEEGYTENNVTENVTEEYNGYTQPQYHTQHHINSATTDNCYLCQWNAYYGQQAGACMNTPASSSNGLQCQYCGFVNQHNETTNTWYQTQSASQTLPAPAAFPDIVKTAVAEALKSADGQNSTAGSTGNMQAHSTFCDVAVAWFLAGFHTSRYLSQWK